METFKTEPVFEDSGVSLMARVKGPAGTYITQGNISSISLKVFDKADGSQIGTEVAPPVGSTVFDTLQTDARWSLDATGYNWRYDSLATLLPTGGITCLIEVKFSPVTGADFHVVYETPVRSLNRS